MKIDKILLADLIDWATPTPVATGLEGRQSSSSPHTRGEGLVNDGIYLYHYNRDAADNAVSRVTMSVIGSELAVMPSSGDDNSSATYEYLPDNFYQDSVLYMGTYVTHVPLPLSPSIPTSAGQVIW